MALPHRRKNASVRIRGLLAQAQLSNRRVLWLLESMSGNVVPPAPVYSPRRQHVRIAPDELVANAQVRGAPPVRGAAVTSLSLGGGFIACSQPPPLGAELMITLIWKGVRQLSVRGRVVAAFLGNEANAPRGSAGICVRFESQSTVALVQLRQLLRQLSQPGPASPMPGHERLRLEIDRLAVEVKQRVLRIGELSRQLGWRVRSARRSLPVL